MIGQEKIKDIISRWKALPRFIILVGSQGCGKKTLAKEFSNRFQSQVLLFEYKIDDIRKIIETANQNNLDMTFVIENGEKMSQGAIATLLKVTEEAPNNSHIVLCCDNKNRLPETLLSRGELFIFQSYNEKDFKDFCSLHKLEYTQNSCLILPNLSYCLSFNKDKIDDLYLLGNKISKEIRYANGANAFKIEDSLQIKNMDVGYLLDLFIYCLNQICTYSLLNARKNNDLKEATIQSKYIDCIHKATKRLYYPLYNKQMIIDKLIIDFKIV